MSTLICKIILKSLHIHAKCKHAYRLCFTPKVKEHSYKKDQVHLTQTLLPINNATFMFVSAFVHNVQVSSQYLFFGQFNKTIHAHLYNNVQKT